MYNKMLMDVFASCSRGVNEENISETRPIKQIMSHKHTKQCLFAYPHLFCHEGNINKHTRSQPKKKKQHL